MVKNLSKKVVVYTAISGNYDELIDPTYIDESFDYVCFSDSNQKYTGCWKIINFPDSNLDEVRKAKEMKILPHKFFPEYEYSIWIDGTVDIIGDVSKLIKVYNLPKFLCFKHPSRNCIYKEGVACILQAKDNYNIISIQLNRYRAEGYPENNGLIDGCILIRRHNDEHVIKVMNDWWGEIINFSRRDQLSFNYVSWKNKFKILTIENENSRGNSQYFINKRRHYQTTKSKIINLILVVYHRIISFLFSL
ncbi:MAG TPA: DUF616 domain-containing protein [Spirochaetota bacterium]|nr:DUF616 domain-containing protein [Spirochaetota bacterium]